MVGALPVLWAPGWESVGDAPLSLEMQLWFPQLATQIASKAGVESSESEMKALRCHGNVHSAGRDEKELRGWVFFLRGDRQFTGRFPSCFFLNQWSSGQPKPLHQTRTCELPIAAGSHKDVTTHVSVTVLTLLCRSLGCVLPATHL